MHITIEQKTLKDALKKIQDCVKKDPRFEFTTHVAITTGVDSVTISATNLDVSLAIQCKAIVSVGGKCIIDRVPLQTLTKHATKETLTISQESDDSVRVQMGSLETVLDSQNYLSLDMPINHNVDYRDINTKELANLIKNTSYAVSTDPERANTMNVCLERSKCGYLSMIATNGHRLAFMRLDTRVPDTFPSILIPKKSLDALHKLLKKCSQDTILLGYCNKHLMIKSNTETISIRPQAGTFPDYKKNVPEDNNIRIKFNNTKLKEAIGAFPLSKENYIITLEITGDKAILTGANTTVVIITLEHIGEDIKVALNYKYLLDVLNTIDGVLVELAFLDSESPVLITEPGNYSKLFNNAVKNLIAK